MDRTHCIFCPNPLDGSDEHIIPDSIRGRLHSKELICSECNLKKFGAKVDPIVKEIFKVTLHVLGFSNAKRIQLKDPSGNKYVTTYGKSTKQVKPDVSIQKKDGIVYVSATGEMKDTVKLFAKTASRFVRKKKDLDGIVVKKGVKSSTPFSFENEIKISPTLELELNKIALEFYALNNLPLEPVKPLLDRIGQLDTTLSNVTFCNWSHEIRATGSDETSHIIVIRSDSGTKSLFCYIELFNIVCAYIPLIENYEGDPIDIVYHQDIFTGERFSDPVSLTLDIPYLVSERESNNKTWGFDFLMNQFMDRKETKDFKHVLDGALLSILEQLDHDIADGKVAKEDRTDIYVKQAAEIVAELSLYNFPYIVEDTSLEELGKINYIHSNLFDGQFDRFCELNQRLIGIEIRFEDDEIYVADSFFQQPVAQIREHKIIKVLCVLRNKENGRLIYVPYRELFEGLRVTPTDNQETKSPDA